MAMIASWIHANRVVLDTSTITTLVTRQAQAHALHRRFADEEWRPRHRPVRRRSPWSVRTLAKSNQRVHAPTQTNTAIAQPHGSARSRLRGLRTSALHDVRHMWATTPLKAGVPTDLTEALGPRETPAMGQRYAHHRVESRRRHVAHWTTWHKSGTAAGIWVAELDETYSQPIDELAESEGFEPPNRLPRYLISSQAPSTTRPALR
jgi:hypothetical protein